MDIQIILVLQVTIKFCQKIEQGQFMNILFLMESKKAEYHLMGLVKIFQLTVMTLMRGDQKIEEQNLK